ncbi:MAG TPA: thioredoxin domain-containing protein [Candidatus Saccharimonadales bacterium]|nr:thioredoxin domain-containing protein [Candidatus Saccharimonadales bacterium]
MTKTRWIIFALLCLGILGLIIITNKNDSSSPYSGDATKAITEGPIADHVFGSTAGKVVLVEYADFQCPGCESVFPLMKEIKEKYKDNLTFVFRNLPLTTIHPNALAAATAAEAAGLQGKFFEYHDLLYQNQAQWKDAAASDRSKTFESYASQLGLDTNKFKSDLTNPDITAKINRDRATASKYGYNSTPTVMLNGQKISQDDTFSKEKLTQLINDEYEKAGLKPPATE